MPGTTLAVAIDHPDRVDKLVLLATDFGDTITLTPSPEVVHILADTTSAPFQLIGIRIPKAG